MLSLTDSLLGPPWVGIGVNSACSNHAGAVAGPWYKEREDGGHGDLFTCPRSREVGVKLNICVVGAKNGPVVNSSMKSTNFD